jgi:salicylate hydroxylase
MRLAPPASLIKWGIFARPPRDHFVSGRVALLGDAAHPMQPFLGLGAAMAIEDAAILGRALAEIVDTDAALAAYDRVRVPRANRVLTLSRQQGELFDGIDPRGFALREAPSHDIELSAFDPRAVALEA